jgi:phosphonate transport system substrate-binding protein
MLSGCSSTPDTIKMYFVPSTEADQVLTSGEQIATLLEESTGLEIEVAVPTSYAAVIEALCAGKADVAWLATFGYVLANDKCGVEAKLTTVRYGSSTYNAEIITQADSVREARGLKPINSLADLEGTKFAFTDPLSTSGYLFSNYMIKNAGVTLGEEIFSGGHTQSVLAVYNGDVDAGACFWSPLRPDGTIGDARRNALTDYPDVGEKVKIVEISDPIPNDTVSFRKDLDQETKDMLVQAILDMAASDNGVELLGELYNITGLVEASDSDYDVVRAMGTTLGFDFEAALED